MGQKVSAIGVRLGVNKEWKSAWCVKQCYSNVLHYDFIIQKYIYNFFWKKKKQVNKCFINRFIGELFLIILIVDLISINIFKKLKRYKKNKIRRKNLKKVSTTLESLIKHLVKWSVICVNRIIGKKKITRLRIKLKKYRKHFHFKLVAFLLEAARLFKNATILTNLICLGLERSRKEKNYQKRFLMLIKGGLKLICKKKAILGIKYKVTGRLDGIDRTRCFQSQIGKISLQSLNAFIDFDLITANTRYGCFGIKVWICYIC